MIKIETDRLIIRLAEPNDAEAIYCAELDNCPTVGAILQHAPEAKENLLK